MRIAIETVVEPPSEERRTPGRIITGEYEISADGTLLHVYAADGRQLGSVKIAPGDDVPFAARRVLRTRRAGGFYGCIPYRPLGLV
jgi:hypothetical protein